MKYIELKKKLLANVRGLDPNDFYLLEGKLIFKSKDTANIVKNYLKDNDYNIIQTSVRNWDHWQGKYESILYFKDLKSSTSE